MSEKKRRAYFFMFVGIFIVFVPILTLYTSGYRIGSGFDLVETGGIYIYSPQSGSEIYINNVKKKTTNALQKDFLIQNMKPGKYAILIAKDGYWPWAKEIVVHEKLVTEAIGFLIPRLPTTEYIPETFREIIGTSTEPRIIENPRYPEVALLFENIESATGTPEVKLSRRSRVSLSYEGQSVVARWLGTRESIPRSFCRDNFTNCDMEVSVFTSPFPIKSFDFYPGREDVVLIAVGKGIYAIEIDTRKTQNFQPVYEGFDPLFVIDGKTLYVKDSDSIASISL